MSKRIALILSGGHYMGIAAHAGALAAILRAGYDVVGISALSAGSIVALGYAHGLTADALDMVPESLLWRSGHRKPGRRSVIGRPPLVVERELAAWAGDYPRLYDTDEMAGADLDKTLRRVLNLRLGETRRDCRVRVWTSNAERPGNPAAVWDTHLSSHADLKSWEVARASMAIPLVFAPQQLEGEWHYDGGVAVGNLPPLDDQHGHVVALYSGHSHPHNRDGKRERPHGVAGIAERVLAMFGGAQLAHNLADNPEVPIVHLPIVGDAGNFGASLEELEATRLDGQRAVEDAIGEGVI